MGLKVPMRSVLSKGGAILSLVLNGGGMMEASHLETEGLTAAATAKFQNSETHLNGFDIICWVTASEDGRSRAISRCDAPPIAHYL